MSRPPRGATDQRPAVSLIVPFVGTDDERAALLERLDRLAVRAGDELIVADNRLTGNGGGSTAAGVIIHPAGGVSSPGFARNRGAARASCPWLVFIDADTEPEPDLLDAYFKPEPAPRTGLLAGRILDVAAAGPEAERPGVAARHAVHRAHMDERVTLERASFPYAQTANCAVRREAFTQVGGFVEEVRAGEDADLCFRLAESGWGLEPRPRAVVRHRTRLTLRDSLHQLARHGAGAAWCNRRHPGSFPAPTAVQMARRLGRAGASSLAALSRGDREAAAFAALDMLEAVAFEGGRLLRNRARR